MGPRRRFILGAWFILLAPPLGTLAWELLRHPAAWSAWSETTRLLTLLRNTLALVAGTLVLSLPVGCLAALVLYRSDLPGRRFFRQCLILALFIPLPVLASAWQAAFGSNGWFSLGSWQTTSPDLTGGPIPWKPWASGLPAAIWVHALAALPWVVWLAGQGFCWVERHLEEDALIGGGVWSTLRHVTLPRALPALGAAALWVGIQTVSEITVTDMMQVRTFAEEVYSQFARPDPLPGASARDVLARALVIAVPPALLTAILVLAILPRWERRLPPLALSMRPLILIRLGAWRWPALVGILALLALLAGVPVGSLVWRTGHRPMEIWSATLAAESLIWAFRAQEVRIVASLAWAGVTGLVTVTLALLACWIARDSRRLRWMLLSVVILMWVLPGPVVGLGLKEGINRIVDIEEAATGGHVALARAALYVGGYGWHRPAAS